jgi:hypothetical protein
VASAIKYFAKIHGYRGMLHVVQMLPMLHGLAGKGLLTKRLMDWLMDWLLNCLRGLADGLAI